MPTKGKTFDDGIFYSYKAMKGLILLVLLGLVLALYVDGRAVEFDIAHHQADTSNYDNCMLRCEELYQDCTEKLSKRDDDESFLLRRECRYDREECETGESARDENIPHYKRIAKPNCQDYTHQRHGL